MADEQLCTVTAHLAWWFEPYCELLGFVCWLMDDEPTDEHMQWVIEKAFRIVLTPCSE